MKLHLLLVVLALVTVSCKTTKLTDTWAPKDHVGKPYVRLMIVGLAANPERRAQYENDFVDKLSNYGVLAVASINVVPELKNINQKTVESWLAKYKLDGVIVTRVTTEKPARHYAPPHLNLGGWYGAWAAESERAPAKDDFYLGTDLFDAKTEELVYSAVVKTKIKDHRTKTIHAVIDELAADMVERGYFQGS